MKISVIAIFYNSAQYVRKCVDSILSQQGDFELELIAVNDCSSDDTLQILNSYQDHRLRVISHTVNKGISAARNTGMDNVTGDCFYFIDGDDYLPENALATLASHFDNKVDWVQGSYAICDVEGKRLSVRKKTEKKISSHDEIIKEFDYLELIYTHNRLINKKWKSIRFRVGKAHEDRFWNVEVFPHLSCIVNVAEPTYCYIAHPASFSNKSRASELYIDSGLELVQEMDKLDSCWSGIRDTFVVTAIEKPLFLWPHSIAYRREIRKKLNSLPKLKTNISHFPRFTVLIHRLLYLNAPDFVIRGIAKVYMALKYLSGNPV